MQFFTVKRAPMPGDVMSDSLVGLIGIRFAALAFKLSPQKKSCGLQKGGLALQ